MGCMCGSTASKRRAEPLQATQAAMGLAGELLLALQDGPSVGHGILQVHPELQPGLHPVDRVAPLPQVHLGTYQAAKEQVGVVEAAPEWVDAHVALALRHLVEVQRANVGAGGAGGYG